MREPQRITRGGVKIVRQSKNPGAGGKRDTRVGGHQTTIFERLIPIGFLVEGQFRHQALTAPRSETTRERISFEIGAIWTHQLRDRSAGCSHWAEHTRRFGEGRYRDEVHKARATLRCDPPE